MLYKQMIKIRDIVSFLIESCHWATYFTILQMISLLLGCSNTLSTNDDWVEQLTALKEGNSIFSFGFNAPPPEGIMIKLSIFRNNIKKPCDIFDLQREEEMSGDFWYINILVDMTNVGEYLIDPLMNEYHQDASSVTLEQVREWKTYRRYPAVRGTVVIKAAPSSLEEWNNGMKLEAEIVAEFPTSPMHEIECFAEGDSEQTIRRCKCEDEFGHISTCVDSNGNGCCIDVEAETMSFSMRVVAEQCAEGCIATSPSLMRYCEELD